MRKIHETIEIVRRKLFDSDEKMKFDGIELMKLRGAEPVNYSSIMLVDWIEKYYSQSAKPRSILDICCGIGTIGLSLERRLRPESVDFADINPKNIESVKLNVKQLLATGENLFTSIVSESDGLSSVKQRKYDLIVSNPPHFLSGGPDKAQVDDELKFHENFFREVNDYLAPRGRIFFIETDEEIPGVLLEAMIRKNKALKFRGIERLDHKFYYILKIGLKKER